MRDVRSKIKSVVAFGPIALNADNTPAAIDLRGSDAAVISIAVGVGGIVFDTTDKVEFKVTHSDDDSTYAAVADADVNLTESNITTVGSGGIVRSLIAAHAAATVVNIGYIGGKRYLKVLADFSGTHGTATPIAVSVIKALPHDAPTA
jgi:hypothetical protein